MTNSKEELRKKVEQAIDINFHGKDEIESAQFKKLIRELWQFIEERDSDLTDPQNENLSRSILASLDDVILSFDYPSLSILYVSPSFTELYGYTFDELPDDPTQLVSHCHEDDKPKIREFTAQLLTNNVKELEYRIILPDNTIRWIFIRVKPIIGSKGEILRLDLVLSDITQQKQFQDFSLQINHVLLNLGTDTENNINKLITLFGELSGATCALYNRLEEGLLCSIGQWSVPPDYNAIDKADGHICFDVIKNNSEKMLCVCNLDQTPYAISDPNVIPYKLKTYIGKAVFCEGIAVGSVCAVFQHDFVPNKGHEHLLDVIASAIGIEETRRKSSRVLKETEEKLMVLINSTPDIICFKDGEGRWLQANDGILKMYCLEGVDYRGKSDAELADFTAGLYRDAFRNCNETDQHAWKVGKSSRIEETIPDVNGDPHIFDVIKVPLFNDDGSRKGIVVFGRDITPRIEAEEQTRFLNKSALEFIEMDDSVNIYEFIGEKVHSLAGKSIVLVTSFDESNQMITLRSLHGVGNALDKLLKILNRHPIGMQMYLSPERKRDVLEQKLTHRKNLYDLLVGAVSIPVARVMETFLNIGTIYEMGFARHEFLLGDVTIITPGKKKLENTDVIEAFIKLAGVALYRRQAKEDLLESEESYRGLFNSISSAVYIMDREGKFLDVNDGAITMYGYQKDRFIGATPEFLSAPGRNESTDIPTLISKTFEGVPQVFEFWGKRSNGEVFPKDVRFYKGKYFGNEAVIVIANDITGQYNMISQLVKAKEVAESSLQKTNSIVSAFPDSIFVIDKDGRLLEFFSNDPDDTLSKHRQLLNVEIEKIMPPEIASLIRRHVITVLGTGQIRKFEYIIPEASGRKFFEARMVRLSDDKVLAVMRNTTERMELMEELYLAKEKAEESDRLKTSFLHNISHEIRTPMNGIVGFSNLLTQPGILPEDITEYNSIINSCSNQLLSIITDIISIATLEAGQEKVREAKTNINELIHVVYAQLLLRATEKNLKLGLTTGLSDFKARVMTDETKLNQILTNLVSNSIKFTTNGEILLNYVLEGEFLKFNVKDTGIGIPEEMQQIIFDRFRQVNNTISSKFGGTGLGLSISKSYIELMGGKIWLESEIGKGTTFYFTIPYKPVYNTHISDSPVDEINGMSIPANKTILIVEDEPINYRLLDKMLQNYGLKLIGVDNAYDAIKYCTNSEEIDLVLMDLKMPGMDGFEATRKIRKIRPDLVIIAQTALALSGDREKALDAGCNDYISKPVRKDELISKLNKYLG